MQSLGGRHLMNIDVWLAYVATILIFMVSPGPSHLLMVSVGMTNGFKKSLATAAGDLSANAMQILLAGFGLAAVVASSRFGFTVIKWAGVAYLCWMGVRTILSAVSHKSPMQRSPSASMRNLWVRGFVTSAANPKAVVFFAALFPQFISPNQSVTLQVLILGITYLVIDGLFLTFYGLSSSWLAEKLNSRYRAAINWLSGLGFIATAMLLGLKKLEERG